MLLDDRRRDRYVPLQEPAQDRVDSGLGLFGRQLQDPKIILGGAAGECSSKAS